MSQHECRGEVIAKLASARSDLREAFRLTTPDGNHDPGVLSEQMRNKLAAVIVDVQDLLDTLRLPQPR